MAADRGRRHDGRCVVKTNSDARAAAEGLRACPRPVKPVSAVGHHPAPTANHSRHTNTASMDAERVVLVAVDDSEDSQKAFSWAIDNVYRDGDQVVGGFSGRPGALCGGNVLTTSAAARRQVHLVHVVPRLAFAGVHWAFPQLSRGRSDAAATATRRSRVCLLHMPKAGHSAGPAGPTGAAAGPQGRLSAVSAIRS